MQLNSVSLGGKDKVTVVEEFKEQRINIFNSMKELDNITRFIIIVEKGIY